MRSVQVRDEMGSGKRWEGFRLDMRKVQVTDEKGSG